MSTVAPSVDRLALTPVGALHAFSREAPDPERAALQSVLAGRVLPDPRAWVAGVEPAAEVDRARLLARGLESGWLQVVHRELRAPDLRLADLFAHLVAGLSADGCAALASVGGFCVGHAGYSPDEAEALCVAAADFNEFGRRQRARGWQGASDMVSFHRDIAMLIPAVSFVPFWVEGVDYCLVLGGEPLLNHPALVELMWGIKAAGDRYAERVPRAVEARLRLRAGDDPASG